MSAERNDKFLLLYIKSGNLYTIAIAKERYYRLSEVLYEHRDEDKKFEIVSKNANNLYERKS